MLLTASNETTKRSQEVVATSDGAMRVDPSGSRYQDLGLIVDTTNVAAGAYAWSNYLNNVQWVRNLVFLVRSDQQYRVFITVKDTTGVFNNDANNDAVTSSMPTSGNSFRIHRCSGAQGILGYSAKLGVKNESSFQAALIQLRAQLLGQ